VERRSRVIEGKEYHPAIKVSSLSLVGCSVCLANDCTRRKDSKCMTPEGCDNLGRDGLDLT